MWVVAWVVARQGRFAKVLILQKLLRRKESGWGTRTLGQGLPGVTIRAGLPLPGASATNG